jgi:hypothetical protein
MGVYGSVAIGTGSAGYCETVADQPSGLVEQLDKRLASIAERMYANVAHLNGVADRVMGAQPEKAQGDQAKNNSFCQLDSVLARLAELEHVNELLGRVTERFSRL